MDAVDLGVEDQLPLFTTSSCGGALDFHSLGAVYSFFAAQPCELAHTLHQKKYKLVVQQY